MNKQHFGGRGLLPSTIGAPAEQVRGKTHPAVEIKKRARLSSLPFSNYHEFDKVPLFHELQVDHLGGVAAAQAQFQDTGIAALPVLELGGYLGEQQMD